MTVHRFYEISAQGLQVGRCTVCGEHTRRSRKFWQTENPFNKDAAGQVKTARQIRSEVTAEAGEWSKGQPTHVRCEVES